MGATYEVGERHWKGDPIGNIVALEEVGPNRSILPYLFQEDGVWYWGRDLDDKTGAWADFQAARDASQCAHMAVIQVTDSKFVSGDRVKYIGKSWAEGRTGTVTRIVNTAQVRVKWDGGYTDYTTPLTHNLIKIDEPAPEVLDPLAVGDRVRYGPGGIGSYEGDTGTVVEISDRSGLVDVNWDSGRDGSWHERGFLTKINEPAEPEVPTRAAVLREAERLITGDRNAHYGEPMDNFQNIAEFWNTFLKYKLKDDQKITPGDTAALMILVKIAREIAGPKQDNKIDISGYAALWAEVDERGDEKA